MSKKRISHSSGIIYSTNPEFRVHEEAQPEAAHIEPSYQMLKVRIDSKQRAGKSVTLVENFIGTPTELVELGKKLKTFCGTGGSVKDGGIIIQGDHRDKVLQWLVNNGYTKTKKI